MTNWSRPSEEEIAELFAEFERTGSRRIRNALVEAHMGFAIYLAKRYANRGVTDDDLRQVSMLALVKAVDRFETGRGVAFTTFAGQTVEGEIKRHFRDKTWTLRVPRSMKELHLAVRAATDELGQELGRSPTVREVAAHLDADVDEVVTAMSVSAAYTPDNFETPRADRGESADRSAMLAVDEVGFGATDDRMAVAELISRLPAREQEIVRLRFYENLTQAEIADRMDMSQMHVSRLLRKSFGRMRRAVSAQSEEDE